MKFKFPLPMLALLALAFLFALGASTKSVLAATPSPFFNGFETDTAGWFTPMRVPSGTHGIMSAAGSWHAEATDDFTRWGGYTGMFPNGGYVTSIDIYLDVNCSANDTRFDWTSAISTPAVTHRRDFAFNGGYYNDTDTTGSGNRFVISASNNAGRGGAYPKNPGRDPFTIIGSGWYTFQHHFYDNGSGVLAVELSILDAGGNVLHMWTLSDASDIIGVTVGGNRYGWFAQNEFPFLPIDNSRLSITCQTATSITANFNGTQINSGKYIWFNSVLKPSGLGSNPVTFRFSNQTISSASINVPVPDAIVTFDPAATTATTSFVGGIWVTRVPSSGLSGNTFLSALNYPVPANIPGGLKNLTWSGTVYTDSPGVSFQWKWAAAVYSSFGADYNSLGVKPVDDNDASIFHNSDHAGTPESFKSFVVGGATGGGGSNFTGGYSGTKSVVPTCPGP
jgi:hypothetical protein